MKLLFVYYTYMSAVGDVCVDQWEAFVNRVVNY